jgi:hypothetical protein
MEGFISGIIGEFQGSSSNMEQNFLIWDNLMDCKSIFLTANTDTVYAFGAIDLKASGIVNELSAHVVSCCICCNSYSCCAGMQLLNNRPCGD